MACVADRPVRQRGLLLGGAAAVASGALFLGGTGLAPVWWLTWLAPIPVLLHAPRAPLRRVAWVAALAQLLGMIGYGYYFVTELQVPVPLVVGLCLVTAAIFTAAVLLFRALLGRGRVLAAVLAMPAAWAGGEYLVAVLTPSGSNWTLANSQADDLPVLQVVSVTGPWGVAFVLLTVACSAAALAAPQIAVPARIRAAGAAALVLATAIGYGLVALTATPATTPGRSCGSVRSLRPGLPSRRGPAPRLVLH